jgi:hypothetical protein
MPIWASVRDEIERTQAADPSKASAYDEVRRAKMKAVADITGRPLLVYASDFLPGGRKREFLPPGDLMITLSDMDGFDEITRDLKTQEVDVLLHSPGGYAEAAESIVQLLRSRCTSVRFVVPGAAKSAATMVAMSGEQLLLDDVSEVGPIDPQMVLQRIDEVVQAPAQTIVDQFERAAKEVKNPERIPVWLPILRGYGPALLEQSYNALKLAEELVAGWLERYMFAGKPDASTHARKVAGYLNDHKHFLSHGRRIGIAELQAQGLEVLDLREKENRKLGTAVRALYYAIIETFSHTGAYKLFENTDGAALIRIVSVSITAGATPPPRPAAKKGRRK